MAAVKPTKRNHFQDSFRAVADDITKGLSTIRSTVADGKWVKWDALCRYVDLNPLLVLYREPVPILNTFVRQYCTGSLAPNVR